MKAAGTKGGRAPGAGALGDLRVLELTAGMAGPWVGRFMAYCGAEVIKDDSKYDNTGADFGCGLDQLIDQSRGAVPPVDAP